MIKTSWKYALALVCAATLACNSGKEPAEKAMKAAEDAVAGAQAEAANLVPDDMAAARAAMEKGDYKTALASAQAVQQKANDVLAKAKTKKDELTAAWTPLSDSVPKMLDAIKSRVDILSQSKKLPKGMDAAKLASAKDGLAAATAGWGEAQEAFKAGKWSDAIAKGTSVKDKATEVMATLGMQAGGAPAK
jgi:lipopolysaccharide biosynthesis regulator YciM